MGFWNDLLDRGAKVDGDEVTDSSLIYILVLTTIITGLSGYEQVSIIIDRILGPTRYIAELIFLSITCYVVYIYVSKKEIRGEESYYKYSRRDRMIAKAGAFIALCLTIMLSYSLWKDVKPLPSSIEARLVCEDGSEAKDYKIELISRRKKALGLEGYQFTDDVGYFSVNVKDNLRRNYYLVFTSPSGLKTQRVLRQYEAHLKKKTDELFDFKVPICD